MLKQEIVPARMLELVREARAALCAGGDAPAPAPGAAPLRDTNAILQDVIFHNALPGNCQGWSRAMLWPASFWMKYTGRWRVWART